MSGPSMSRQPSWGMASTSSGGGDGHDKPQYVVSIIGPGVIGLPRIAGVVEAAVRSGTVGDSSSVSWHVAVAAGPEVQPDVVIAVIPPASGQIIPDKDQRVVDAIRRAVSHVVIVSSPDGNLSPSFAHDEHRAACGEMLPRDWDGVPIVYSDYELMAACQACAQELTALSTSATRDNGDAASRYDRELSGDEHTRGENVSTPSAAATAVLSDIGVVRVPETKMTYDVSPHALLPSNTLRNWLHAEEKQRRDSMAVINQNSRATMDRAIQDAYRSASSEWRSCLDPQELPEIIDAATDQLNENRPDGTEPVPYIDVPFDPPAASLAERILIISLGISLGLGVARMVVMPLTGTAFGVSISLGIAFGLLCAVAVSYMRHQQLQNNFRRVGGAEALSLARDQWVDHARQVMSHAEENRVRRLRSGGLRTVALQEALAHAEMVSSRRMRR